MKRVFGVDVGFVLQLRKKTRNYGNYAIMDL